MVDDLLGADGVPVKVRLSVRRGDEGAHLGQDALLVGVHVVVHAVPDGCSSDARSAQFQAVFIPRVRRQPLTGDAKEEGERGAKRGEVTRET